MAFVDIHNLIHKWSTDILLIETIENWLVDHVGQPGIAFHVSSKSVLHFERDEDLTLFLLKWGDYL